MHPVLVAAIVVYLLIGAAIGGMSAVVYAFAAIFGPREPTLLGPLLCLVVVMLFWPLVLLANVFMGDR